MKVTMASICSPKRKMSTARFGQDVLESLKSSKEQELQMTVILAVSHFLNREKQRWRTLFPQASQRSGFVIPCDPEFRPIQPAHAQKKHCM